MTDPNNNILIICRDIKSAHKLWRFKPESQNRYILASDDPRVREAAKRYSWIDEVCWIEQMESFYNVAEDVIKYLEVVNQWLESLADDEQGIPKELLFWIRHAEGGMTTQRIQDLLLLIRSYRFILDTYKITGVIVLSQPGMHWEDDVFIKTALSRGINSHVIDSFRIKVLFGTTKAFLKVYVREIYYIFHILMIKLRYFFRNEKPEKVENEVVVQLCSSALKHLAQTVPLMKALKDKGMKPVALCWSASERYTRKNCADRIRDENLKAVELENFVPTSSLLTISYRVFQTWREAIKRRKSFLLHPALKYHSVEFGSLLWPSMHFFICAELGQRYRFQQAIKKYFELHFPIAIRFWTLTLAEGIISWMALKNIKNKIKRCLVFDYWAFAYNIHNPYKTKIEGLDLALARGLKHKSYLEHHGIQEDNIVIVGSESADYIGTFKALYNPIQSLYYLNIPSSFLFYILYDPGYILRGYLSVNEQVHTTRCLLSFAKTNPSVALVIKPHPSHKSGILESLISDYSLKNVFLVDKGILPYHAINASNLLITKFSTLGLDAMQFGVPIVSVLLDREQHFKIYENAAWYVYSIKELNMLLTQFMTDANFRSQGITRYAEKQKDFIAQETYQTSFSAVALSAEAIINRLSRYNSFCS